MLKGFNASLMPLALGADVTLLDGSGSIRFGWTTTTLSASGRLRHVIVSSKETQLPLVTMLVTGGTWLVTRLLAVSSEDDAILQSLGVDYFDEITATY